MSKSSDFHEIAELLAALHFAADRHRDQRRKGLDRSPYINHPIQVAETLATVGGVDDVVTLQAAVLHDVVEDTETTLHEIEARFGAEVRAVVEEVTDDRALSKAERKQLQVERTSGLSERARQVRLGDKICNVTDLGLNPPDGWDLERRREYLDWTERVIAGCRGTNTALETRYAEALAESRSRLAGRS